MLILLTRMLILLTRMRAVAGRGPVPTCSGCQWSVLPACSCSGQTTAVCHSTRASLSLAAVLLRGSRSPASPLLSYARPGFTARMDLSNPPRARASEVCRARHVRRGPRSVLRPPRPHLVLGSCSTGRDYCDPTPHCRCRPSRFGC